MTRDFNKPRRDASNSSFRNSSPNRNRDERPPRSRLNRETVDRAWESGAQQQHADYHPRTGGGQYRTQGQRNNGNGRPNNSPNRQDYSPQNGRSGSRPYNRTNYDNRQDNFRDNRSNNYRDDRGDRGYRDSSRSFDRPSGGNNAYRPARPPYDQDRGGFGGQRFDNHRNSFENPNRRGNDSRQQFGDRGNARWDNDRPRWQNRPDEQRNSTRGPERNFNRRYNSADEHFEGDYERFDERSSRSSRFVERGYEGRASRPQRPNDRPSTDNDAWHTRSSREERLEDHNKRDARPPRPTDRPFSGSHSFQDRPERRASGQKNEVAPEKHVTRLPDGRVVKGSRPAQRKKAQFWTDIASDRDELVSHVQETDKHTQNDAAADEIGEIPQISDEGIGELVPAIKGEAFATSSAEGPTVTDTMSNEDVAAGSLDTRDTSNSLDTPDLLDASTNEEISETTPRKRRVRTTSTVASTKKPRSTGPRPSQRGFKWPTQE